MIPPAVVAAADLALLVALAAAVMREIIAAKNWRNLGVLALLGIFAFGNGVFHCEAARGEFAAQGQGLRIAIGAGVMMIALVGGRIVPAFTRNWLVQNNPGRLPVPPGQVFDKVALAVLLAGRAMQGDGPRAAHRSDLTRLDRLPARPEDIEAHGAQARSVLPTEP